MYSKFLKTPANGKKLIIFKHSQLPYLPNKKNLDIYSFRSCNDTDRHTNYPPQTYNTLLFSQNSIIN